MVKVNHYQKKRKQYFIDRDNIKMLALFAVIIALLLIT